MLRRVSSRTAAAPRGSPAWRRAAAAASPPRPLIGVSLRRARALLYHHNYQPHAIRPSSEKTETRPRNTFPCEFQKLILHKAGNSWVERRLGCAGGLRLRRAARRRRRPLCSGIRAALRGRRPLRLRNRCRSFPRLGQMFAKSVIFCRDLRRILFGSQKSRK